MEKYNQCGRWYFLHYLRGIREKVTGSALIFGSAFDKGLNTLLVTENPHLDYLEEAKLVFLKAMQTNKLNYVDIDLETTDLVSYGNEDFDDDILTDSDRDQILSEFSEDDIPDFSFKTFHKDCLELKRAKTLKGKKLRQFNYMSWVSLKRKGLLFLDAYNEQVLPNIKRIIAIQKEFSVKNDEGDEFNGFIVLIAEYHDGRIVIFDNKTSASRYKDDSVVTSKQLASYYGILEELNLDLDPKQVHIGYIVIVKKIRKKKLPLVDIQILIEKPNEKLVEEVFSNYDEVNKAIHDGKFPAKPETCRGFFGKCFCSLKKEETVDISVHWDNKRR